MPKEGLIFERSMPGRTGAELPPTSACRTIRDLNLDGIPAIRKKSLEKSLTMLSVEKMKMVKEAIEFALAWLNRLRANRLWRIESLKPALT